MISRLSTIALFVALWICFARPAYGYIDPGSGLLVCQSIGAMFAGVLFYARRRLRSFVRRRSGSESES